MASDKNDSKKTDSTPAADALEDIAKAAADSPVTPTPADDKLPSEDTNEPVATPTEELISAPAADAAPASEAPTPTAPAEPVVVTDKDVAPASGGQSGEKLAEEIEVLTGEIQALEAKIERLTSGAVAETPKSETPLSSASLPPISGGGASPLGSQPIAVNAESSTSSPIVEPPSSPESSAPTQEVGDAMINKPSDASASTPVPITTSNSSPVGDLYSDIKKREQEAPTPKDELKEQAGDEPSSGLAIIAEVIAVFGVVLFIILAVSPFFREILGDDTYQAVQQIGWLSALGTLGLGLILMLFGKGRGLFKTMLFILLLLATVLFLALQESSLLSSVSDYVEPLVQFYR